MNTLFKLLVVLVFSTVGHAQSEYPHVLILKNGTEIKGKAFFWNNRKVVFRLASTGKKEEFKYKTLKTIKSSDPEKAYEGAFVLKQLKGTDKTLRLIRVVSGELECFYQETSSSYYTYGTEVVATTVYYIGRQHEDFVAKVKNGPRFKKRFLKDVDGFFNDCPDVMSKIEKGFFDGQLDATEEVVRYYNTKC
ncbi:hypothetical protein [Aquimarina rubra]|uniref:DUF4369 domain-containing protein n=1 Tax=Aquimarina rubra TaxID=1920033 RepID=A0ABW5LFF4_9FLAO